jgi:hypothetical protein
MAGLEVAVDHFPLVRIVVRGGATDDDYRELFTRMNMVMDRGERFVCLAEAQGAGFPSATQRRIINEWYPSLKARVNQLSVGQGLVLTTALQRGAITALSWIMRPDVPMAAFETRADALAWCRDRLAEHEIAIPPALDALFRGGTHGPAPE